MKLAIINCAKRKQPYPCGPREMYWKSLLFRSQIQFIESRYDDWMVISSVRGLLTQDQIIEPYDAYLNDNGTGVTEDTEHFSAEYKREWGIRVAKQLQPYLQNQVDAFISSAYTRHLPQLPIRFLKVNSGGAGLFRGIQMWKKLAASTLSVEQLIEQGEIVMSGGVMRKDPPGHYKEDVSKVVNWVHDEYGEFYGCARDIAKTYHKDESNLKNVAIGKTKSSYGWKLNDTNNTNG